ncbi:MAG: helix-turn-helix transcriptional regulator [Bacteroidota bacterium]
MTSTMVGRLEILRRSTGLNQAQFAYRIGLQPGSYSDIKKGKLKSGISKKILNKLETEFGANIEWLKTGNGEMFIIDKTDTIQVKEAPASKLVITKHVYDVYAELALLKEIIIDLKSDIKMLKEKSLGDSRLTEMLARTIENLTDRPETKNELSQNQGKENPSKNYLDKVG